MAAVRADRPALTTVDPSNTSSGPAVDRYGSDAPELTVAKRIEEDAEVSFRLSGDWVAPWEVEERAAHDRAGLAR